MGPRKARFKQAERTRATPGQRAVAAAVSGLTLGMGIGLGIAVGRRLMPAPRRGLLARRDVPVIHSIKVRMRKNGRSKMLPVRTR